MSQKLLVLLCLFYVAMISTMAFHFWFFFTHVSAWLSPPWWSLAWLAACGIEYLTFNKPARSLEKAIKDARSEHTAS